MDLSIKGGEPNSRWFDIATNAADMGYFTKLGAEFYCIPDSENPWPVDVVRAIRREFDPAFVPIWVRQAWLTPAKTVLVVGRHMVGRYVPYPANEYEPLNVFLPTTSVGGIHFRHPIIESTTLEIAPSAMSELEKSSGGSIRRELGQYVPFDNRVYLTMKAIWHQNHNKRRKEIKREVVSAQLDPKAMALALEMEEQRYALKTDWSRIERIRQAETQYDRQRAAAPPATKPMVFHQGTA